jgi:hypothetical protein
VDYGFFYGLATADGKIVLDGVCLYIRFIDADDGYYEISTGEEVFYITADGSRRIDIKSNPVFIGDGKIRVFEWREDGEYIGVIDLDGNVISPFISVNDNFYIAEYSGLYMNKSTGEAFFSVQGQDADIISAHVNENGKLKAIVRNSRVNNYWYNYDITIQLTENAFYSSNPAGGVTITDKDGKVLKTFERDAFVQGDLLTASGYVYDFDLNEIEFLRGEPVWEHLSGNLYTFGHYDPEKSLGIIDISNGSKVSFPKGVMLNKAGDELVIAYSWIEFPQRYGLFTVSGEEVLPMRYNILNPLRDELFQAHADNYMGIINQNGEWLIRIDALRTKPD